MARNDAALDRAWQAIQHQHSSDEEDEELLIGQDDLHEEDFFPRREPKQGASLDLELAATAQAFEIGDPLDGVETDNMFSKVPVSNGAVVPDLLAPAAEPDLLAPGARNSKQQADLLGGL